MKESLNCIEQKRSYIPEECNNQTNNDLHLCYLKFIAAIFVQAKSQMLCTWKGTKK